MNFQEPDSDVCARIEEKLEQFGELEHFRDCPAFRIVEAKCKCPEIGREIADAAAECRADLEWDRIKYSERV